MFLKLTKNISILAPMEDVTDLALRRVLINYGLMPYVFFTEFTNVEGIATGKLQVLHRLNVDDITMGFPTIVQLWGSDKVKFYNAVFLSLFLGYWGIDLNMGCPVKKVIKKGLGAGIINNMAFARELVDVVRQAIDDFWNCEICKTHWQALIKSRLRKTFEYLNLVKDNLQHLEIHPLIKEHLLQNIELKQDYLGRLLKQVKDLKPTLSIKTRLSNAENIKKDGVNEETLAQIASPHGYFTEESSYNDPWLEEIFTWPVDFITVHLRTAEEMSKVPAHYEVIEYINAISAKHNLPWIINGDIFSLQQGENLINGKNSIGFMIGRGIFRNPFIFTGYKAQHEFNCQGKGKSINLSKNKLLDECISSKYFLAEVFQAHQVLFNKFFNTQQMTLQWTDVLEKYKNFIRAIRGGEVKEVKGRALDIESNGLNVSPRRCRYKNLTPLLAVLPKKQYQLIKNKDMLIKFKKMYKIAK